MPLSPPATLEAPNPMRRRLRPIAANMVAVGNTSGTRLRRTGTFSNVDCDARVMPHLPDLVVMRIMYFLPYRSACRLERVNKRWRRLSQSSNLDQFDTLETSPATSKTDSSVTATRSLRRLSIAMPTIVGPSYVVLDGLLTKHAPHLTRITLCWHVLAHVDALLVKLDCKQGRQALFSHVTHFSVILHLRSMSRRMPLSSAKMWFHKLRHCHWQVHASPNNSENDVRTLHEWVHNSFHFVTCSAEVHVEDDAQLPFVLHAFQNTPLTLLKLVNGGQHEYVALNIKTLCSNLHSPVYQLSLRGMHVGELDIDEWPRAMQSVTVLRCSSTYVHSSVMEVFDPTVLVRWEVYGDERVVSRVFAECYPDVWRALPKTYMHFTHDEGLLFSA